MSCYDYERGTIRIPTKEYANLKRNMISEMKNRAENNYKEMLDLYEKIVTEAKGKRNVKWNYLAYKFNMDSSAPLSTIFRNGEDKKPLKPKKSDFKPTIDRKQLHITNQNRDWSLEFFDENKAISWNVFENNHATRDAHEESIVISIFNHLHSIKKWGKNTGGMITGNDEYNIDSGNGEYIKMEYGKR